MIPIYSHIPLLFIMCCVSRVCWLAVPLPMGLSCNWQSDCGYKALPVTSVNDTFSKKNSSSLNRITDFQCENNYKKEGKEKDLVFFFFTFHTKFEYFSPIKMLPSHQMFYWHWDWGWPMVVIKKNLINTLHVCPKKSNNFCCTSNIWNDWYLDAKIKKELFPHFLLVIFKIGEKEREKKD